MNDPMRILKADHREVEQLLKRLADTDEGDERNRLAREVQTKLTSHMEIEETIVYPPVSDEVGEEDREEAEIEHRLARLGLETMMSMLDQPGFGASVQMLLGGITHHVEEEERELLPELRDALDRDDWLAIGDAIAAAKQEAGLPVPTSSSSARRSSKRRGRASGASRAGESKRRSGGNAKKSPAKKSTAKSPTRKSTGTSSTRKAAAKKSTAKPGARKSASK